MIHGETLCSNVRKMFQGGDQRAREEGVYPAVGHVGAQREVGPGGPGRGGGLGTAAKYKYDKNMDRKIDPGF